MVLDRSPEGLDWSAALHSQHIQHIAVPTAPPAPIAIDDAASKEMLKEPSDSKSSKDAPASELLPEVIKHMIIKMSSTQDDVFLEEFCASYSEIMKQKKIIPATQDMQLLMRSMKCQVKVSIPLMTAIRHGNFLSDSIAGSHAFPPFSVGYFDAANSDSQHQIKLDLLQSDGEGLSKEMVDSLLKENCSIPYSFHRLRHQLNNWLGVIIIVFGPKCLIVKELQQWVKHMDEKEQSYDGCFKVDTDFGVKALGLIERTFYQFAASCQSAKSPEEVNFVVLLLHHKHEEIEQISFQAN